MLGSGPIGRLLSLAPKCSSECPNMCRSVVQSWLVVKPLTAIPEPSMKVFVSTDIKSTQRLVAIEPRFPNKRIGRLLCQ